MVKVKPSISKRVSQIPKSAIHEMTRLSKEVEDVAFLSWAKPELLNILEKAQLRLSGMVMLVATPKIPAL